MPRWWILTFSVAFGALAAVVGYIAWLLELGFYRWWPWAGGGAFIGLAIGLIAAWPERSRWLSGQM